MGMSYVVIIGDKAVASAYSLKEAKVRARAAIAKAEGRS